MACETVGNTVVAVHNADPPSKEAWDEFISMCEALFARAPDRARSLVITEGGGPSFAQRQQINAVLKGRALPAAVVSSNAFIRSIVAALSIFNPKIKVFRPELADDAVRYLGLTEVEGKAVWRCVAKLKAELGIVSKRGG